MLTAIILAYETLKAGTRPARSTREAVVRSLASLVEACVQGLVADAVLAGPPGSALQEIADEAGCRLVETPSASEGLPQALALARHADIFLLLAGHAVERGFVDEVRDAFAHGDRDRALILRAAPYSLITRLAPHLAAPVGLVARKEALLAVTGMADVRKLARRLRGAELSTRARQAF